jgi:glutamine synthetase
MNPFRFTGSPGFGPRSEVPLHQEILDLEYGNMRVNPDPDTFHVLPWAGGEEARIAQVLCDAYWIQTGKRHGADPRHIAQNALDQLQKEFGYKCLIGWEYEFFLVDKKTQKPVFDGFDIYSTQLLAEFEPFLAKMDKLLTSTGINIEYIMTEYESGQFECPTVAKYGMDAVDKALLLKEGIKEISFNEGFKAVFMTKPFKDMGANGLHFNHSLWDSAGHNAFFDETMQDKMSDQFRWWIGGIFKHFKSLVAICCPTVNCYRRLYAP